MTAKKAKKSSRKPAKKAPAEKAPARKSAKKATTKGVKRATKAKRFAEEFVANGGNATKAAKTVGATEVSAREIGRRLLTNVDTQTHIREFAAARAAEAKVRAVEVIGLLGSHLRADLALVVEPNGTVDLQECHKRGVSHWIKKIRTTQRFILGGEGGESEIERKTELEIHDSQSAAARLAKIFGLEQAPRQNERERVEQAITEYIERKRQDGEVVTREQAIVALADSSAKFARLLSEVGA